jgi:uncharacterized membrane protein YgcG
MRPFLGLSLVALTTTACGATYTYVPATNAPPASLYGHPAADYAIPPQAPRGDLRIASYGIEPLSPEGGDDESVGSLHIRLAITNKSDQPWTIDTREQQAALEGHATSTPAFASASRGTGSPPLVTVAPNTTRLVDVFFPLPEDMQKASAVPAFRFTSTVHTDAGPVSETTPFDRVETDGDSAVAADDSAPQAEYDPDAYGYDYWDAPFYYNPTFIGFYGGVYPRGYWGRPFYARGWGWGRPGYYHGGYRGGVYRGGFHGGARGGFHGGGGGRGGGGGHGGGHR